MTKLSGITVDSGVLCTAGTCRAGTNVLVAEKADRGQPVHTIMSGRP